MSAYIAQPVASSSHEILFLMKETHKGLAVSK
jgi:hypothetical protein